MAPAQLPFLCANRFIVVFGKQVFRVPTSVGPDATENEIGEFGADIHLQRWAQPGKKSRRHLSVRIGS
jgi:hypothetical protein